jgi:hypothetical protein
LVAIVKTYLEGGAATAGAGSSSTADRYQLVVHVDEAGRAWQAADREPQATHRVDADPARDLGARSALHVPGLSAHAARRSTPHSSLGRRLGNERRLCWFHHHLLHEGRFAIRRDYRGERYFVRADGRAIPRCGYRADDYTDDDVGENPSMEGASHADTEHANPSLEVREPRGVYRLKGERRVSLA